MLDIHQSQARKGNSQLVKAQRSRGQDNLEWLREHLGGTQVGTVVILLGGKDVFSHRLRTAQAHARHDLSPSHWSDVFLLADPLPGKSDQGGEAVRLCGISLTPRSGFGFPPLTNAVQEVTMEWFTDPKRYPNIAVLCIPVPPEPVHDAMHRFTKQANVINATELLIRWLAYGWGVAPNPLLDGQGIPGAVFLDAVFSAANYDLTPGLANHSCCPEAIWQAAKWWQELPRGDAESRMLLSGAYILGDPLP